MNVTRGKETSSKHPAPFIIDLGTNDLGWRSVECIQGNKQMNLKVTTTAGRSYYIDCGYQQWMLSSIEGQPLNFRPFKNNFSDIPEPFLVSSSYGWTTPDDLYFRLNFVNWLSSCLLHFNLKNGQVSADLTNSYTTKSVGIKAYLK